MSAGHHRASPRYLDAGLDSNGYLRERSAVAWSIQVRHGSDLSMPERR